MQVRSFMRIIFSRHGFNIKKLICLGFIGHPGYYYSQDESRVVTNEFIMDSSAVYEIDIAGHRFPLTPHIHSLSLSSNTSKKYIPTPVVSYKSDISH